MKTLLFIVTLFVGSFSHGQSVKEVWGPILSDPNLATYFSGMWEAIGVNIEETGEKITVNHKGDHFELKDGIDVDNVDYNVHIKLKNMSNMVDYSSDGKISEYESYRMMAVLFTPFVRATLKHPMMNKSGQMKMAGIENHVHVYLKSPTNEEFVAHTLIFVNKKWLVIEGIHGTAKRVFNMTLPQAIEYQSEAFKAQKADSNKAWRAFKKFYLNWRKDVSKNIEK